MDHQLFSSLPDVLKVVGSLLCKRVPEHTLISFEVYLPDDARFVTFIKDIINRPDVLDIRNILYNRIEVTQGLKR
jgi:hypothetical protein